MEVAVPFRLIVLYFIITNSCTGAKMPLYVGALFPMTSEHNDGWTGGNGIQPAAQMAFDHVNGAGVLNDYELRMIWNDTKGSPGWAEHIIFEFLHNEPRKIMFLGAGYSWCSTVVAALAGLEPWAIPQISYSSTSPELSVKTKYPYFYRTIPDDTSFSAPRVALLKTFKWSHVGVIFHEEGIHRTAISDLHVLFLKNGIRQTTTESFRENARVQMENLKNRGARIIIANFFGKGARQVFCEAYKLRMFGAKYVWILLGYMEREWWLVNDPSITCSSQELAEAMDGYLATDYLWNTGLNTKTVYGKTVKDFFAEYDSRVSPKLRDVHCGYAYDAVWAMALALNRTISKMAPNTRLDKVPYGDKTLSAFLTEALRETNFSGVTGPVGFNSKGNRAGDTQIVQMKEGEQVTVGLYRLSEGTITWSGYEAITWKGGSPPPDRTKVVYELMSVSLPLFIFMAVVTSLAILISIFFLWFNIAKRNVRFIKMSSPNLNNSVLLGCTLSYISVFLFGLDGGFISSGYETVCASRAWTLSLGFSLAYGAMFSKTWRVHLIFTNKILKRKVIKDRHLFAVVCVLVIVDIIYLTVWQVTDPMTRTVREFPQESLDSDLDVLLVKQLELCESKETYRWLGILCGYKGLLLLFGAFLAWETRNVTIPALNDSKYIGMSVYNVFILCVIGAPISLAMREQPDASFSIVSVCIIICTSITLCLVFIPKVVLMLTSFHLHEKSREVGINCKAKSPPASLLVLGKVLEMKKFLLSGDQLRPTFTSSALVLETNSIMPAVDIDTERQIIDLKRKINDKDKEIRELRLRLMNSAGVKHPQRIELKTSDSVTPIDTN